MLDLQEGVNALPEPGTRLQLEVRCCLLPPGLATPLQMLRPGMAENGMMPPVGQPHQAAGGIVSRQQRAS